MEKTALVPAAAEEGHIPDATGRRAKQGVPAGDLANVALHRSTKTQTQTRSDMATERSHTI